MLAGIIKFSEWLLEFNLPNLFTKGTGNGNRLNLEDITQEILETKPMNSPKPDK